MKKVALGASALALVFLVSGCGDSPDAVMKDMIKLMNDRAEAVESAKDKDSAEKAKAKLEEINKQLKDVIARDKKIKVTEAQEKKLEEKYKEDIEKAVLRFDAAAQKLQNNPEAAKIIQPALEDWGKMMLEAGKSGK